MLKIKKGDLIWTNTVMHGIVVNEVLEINIVCPHCSDNDGISTITICDDNIGLATQLTYDNTYASDIYVMPDVRKGFTITTCAKMMERDKKKLKNDMMIINDPDRIAKIKEELKVR